MRGPRTRWSTTASKARSCTARASASGSESMLVRTLIPHALVALAAASAYAHEPPRGIGLLWASDAASTPSVIVANRGLVFVEEADSGPRFSLRCAEAYGATISDRPGVFVAP